MITVEQAHHGHILPFVADIREEDRDEWYAATGEQMELLLALAIADAEKSGDMCRAAVLDGSPLAIWGVVSDPVETSVGTGWLVATNRAATFGIQLHGLLARQMAEIDSRFSIVECWADQRNTLHHRWIGWLGFDYVGQANIGPFGLPFTHYARKSPWDVPSSSSASVPTPLPSSTPSISSAGEPADVRPGPRGGRRHPEFRRPVRGGTG